MYVQCKYSISCNKVSIQYNNFKSKNSLNHYMLPVLEDRYSGCYTLLEVLCKLTRTKTSTDLH